MQTKMPLQWQMLTACCKFWSLQIPYGFKGQWRLMKRPAPFCLQEWSTVSMEYHSLKMCRVRICIRLIKFINLRFLWALLSKRWTATHLVTIHKKCCCSFFTLECSILSVLWWKFGDKTQKKTFKSVTSLTSLLMEEIMYYDAEGHTWVSLRIQKVRQKG